MGGNKVDIARDERMRKFDQLFDQFYKIYKMPRLIKLIEK